ncbi:Nitrate reductase [NADPH] [Babesia sp. Xinjiang]|uniref:Nitrate reductase [NADPH] n=1 Tax=Babesia sp. Xinjiang TaxID=462227 RepID=UPI000A220998|nr:Nitrate reductase [NADPH] [Babesia sp. Xinjiang]ORM41721.1 Nitrate reductase [NADPH] [Babesia sp. Xinjiang]
MAKVDEVESLIEQYCAGEGFEVPAPPTLDTELVLRVTLARRIAVSPTAYIFVIAYPEEYDADFNSHVFAHYLIYGERKPPTTPGKWNGTPMLKHEGTWVSRKYTPIFIDHTRREVHFLIRIYRACDDYPDGGRLTRFLETIEPGHPLVLNPWHARFKLIRPGALSPVTGDVFEFKTLNIVAGGTGITPYIRFLLHNKTTQVKLLFCNKTVKEILLKKLLDKLQERGLLEVRYLVTSESQDVIQHFRPKKNEWLEFGKLSKEYMEAFFEPDESCTVFCGPTGMVVKTRTFARELGLTIAQ